MHNNFSSQSPISPRWALGYNSYVQTGYVQCISPALTAANIPFHCHDFVFTIIQRKKRRVREVKKFRQILRPIYIPGFSAPQLAVKEKEWCAGCHRPLTRRGSRASHCHFQARPPGDLKVWRLGVLVGLSF